MGWDSQARRTCAAALGSLLLGFALPAAEPSAHQGLFPPHSTVLLLVGLPGDVESEESYRDQLQTCLDLLAASRQAASVFVLCDDPQALTLPSIKALKGDRTNFLALGPVLAAATNPLVVIAWGHGGRQGSTPVFHVRGPRLTAADFSSLARQSAAPESRWVVMFRGSGSFAAALAAENRQVLSSEHETMFASDPVGMPLLLKIARENPQLPFAAVAEELGRATEAWYTHRHLARTEEPTLWAGTDKPRPLAVPPAEEDSPASSVPADAKTAVAAPLNTPQPATNAASADLPPVWNEIRRLEARKYPEADAVILRRRLSYTLGSQPALATEQEEFIQVLTPEGKQFGDFDVTYSPPHEDITFLDCEVLRPDGKLARLDPDNIREGHEQSVGDYHRERRKFFSLPGVTPGAVLHVRYRTTWKTFPMPHVSLEIPIGQNLAVLDQTIQVSLPKETPFHFALEQIAAADPALKPTTYGTTYSWRFQDLPPQQREVLVSPGFRSRLLISTFPDWAAFAEWYERISKLADEVTPEIAAKARELTREAKSDPDKVLALYNYVTGLRYVAVPLGVNSFRPHAAANVLQNEFGDCKDKANLFNALLRSLQIEARLVLVPRFSQAHEALPGLSFNHAISRVTLDAQTLWVDTTDDVCRFGMLPPGDPGRKVLVIGGGTHALTELPAPDPRDHRLTLRGELDCSSPADPLPVKLNATAQGYPDYELRGATRDAKGRAFTLPLLATRFRPAVGSFALESQQASSVAALNEAFTWHATGACVGLLATVGGRSLLRAPFWLPKEWDLALHRRKTGLYLNQGYPLTLEQEFQFNLPAGAQPPVLPGVSENNAPPLRWKLEWNNIADHRLSARMRAELDRGELSPAETPLVQKQLSELLTALGAGASLPAPP